MKRRLSFNLSALTEINQWCTQGTKLWKVQVNGRSDYSLWFEWKHNMPVWSAFRSTMDDLHHKLHLENKVEKTA